ncbi:OLC1v1024420C1 [Oldenlandia corymbosa var. corymbosa]|uniref:OLC1v1024420C1 n=1 Tax=Oldenlandia corymbosa var. corymbosa TaxID=529605 RepID=A0AAV1C2I8_OLDCO|nr:OLC1v1024420C1 [Oldenlandia corymbosa var. corymbosa]
MKKAGLVFIPAPGMGHLVPTVEAAKVLSQQNDLFSITVLILRMPFDSTLARYAKFLPESPNYSGIKFVELQRKEEPGITDFMNLYKFIDSHKSHVREILTEISASGSGIRLAGVVVDMLCTSMIDLANEFGAPSYVFFASSAAMLGLFFHMQTLRDDFDEDVTEFGKKNEESEDQLLINVPTYINPVPPTVLPSVLFEKDGACEMLLNQVKRYRETKGILINTFSNLESHALQALRDEKFFKNIPPVFAIGPLVRLNQEISDDHSVIITHSYLIESRSLKIWLTYPRNRVAISLANPFKVSRTWKAHYVKSIVYAGLESIVTSLSLISSISGGRLSSVAVFVLGFPNLVADGISVRFSDFISTRTEIDMAENDVSLTKREVTNH